MDTLVTFRWFIASRQPFASFWKLRIMWSEFMPRCSTEKDEEWKKKRAPGCLVYIGGDILPSYMGIVTYPVEQDPHWTNQDDSWNPYPAVFFFLFVAQMARVFLKPRLPFGSDVWHPNVITCFHRGMNDWNGWSRMNSPWIPHVILWWWKVSSLFLWWTSNFWYKIHRNASKCIYLQTLWFLTIHGF